MRKEHYLDNSATTPLCGAAREKMIEIMEHVYGNPSSLHTLGVEAEEAVNEARSNVLAALSPIKTGLHPKPENLIFTASGTEANNLAIIGSAAAKERNRGKTILVGETEHASVLESAAHLASLGFHVVRIPSPQGAWDMEAYRHALGKDVILVCAMLVNNETGAVNDLAQIAALARAANPDVLIHCDAVQGFLKIEGSPAEHADMVTISAHKIGGPKGVGALYINDKIRKTRALSPVIFGGGQEWGMRSGTENVIGIAGFGAAAADGSKHFSDFLSQMQSLRHMLEDRLARFSGSGVRINLPQTVSVAPHIVSLTVPGIRSETLLHSLSARGVFVSSGSACSSNTGHASDTLRSFGLSKQDADCTIRISFGMQNTEDDIEALCQALESSLHTLARIKR